MIAVRIAAGALVLALASPSIAREPVQTSQVSTLPAEARSAASVVDSFHAALRRGDTQAALRLLVDDALIFEAGGVERSKAEYAAHHLAADSEFSQAVRSIVMRRAGGSDGRIAWIASEGRSTGTFRGRNVDRTTAETMLLRRVGDEWRIAHIHWSSAAAAPVNAAASVPLLAGSVPANGSAVRGPIERLELRFARPTRLLEVTIAGPEGRMPMMVTAPEETTHYSLPLPTLPPGAYSVDWRATAAGREDRGTFSFKIE